MKKYFQKHSLDGNTICCSQRVVPKVPILYTVAEIQNALPFGQFKLSQPQNLNDSSLATVHNPTRFHKTRLSTFWLILFKYKQRDAQTLPSQFLGSQPTGDISHKPGGRPPLLSTRPVVSFPAKEIGPLGRYQEVIACNMLTNSTFQEVSNSQAIWA